MDGLARAAGAGNVLTVTDGPMKGTWLMGGMTAKDFGLVEQHLLTLRGDPIMEALPRIKALEEAGMHTMARRLERLAMREALKGKGANKIPAVEVQEWIDSIDGLMFTSWVMLRKNHPAMTLEQTQQIYDSLGEAEMRKRRDKAAALDFAGNSTGPAAESGAAGPNGAPNRSTGGPLSDSSPLTMAYPPPNPPN